MAKLILEQRNDRCEIEFDDDANISTYSNAFIKCLMFATFCEGNVKKLFGTTYFDDGDI